MRLRWIVPLVAMAMACPAPGQDGLGFDLTELQLGVLRQVFTRYDFTAPSPGDGALAVEVEPVAPGGVYRLGEQGDLPATVRVTLRAGGTEPVAPSYRVVNFYGQEASRGTMEPLAPGASADLVLGEIDRFGYYHVAVRARAGGAEATGTCGFVVVHPFARTARAGAAFGALLPPGDTDGRKLRIARRLGAGHVAMDVPREGPDGGAVTAAELGAPGLVATGVVDPTAPGPEGVRGLGWLVAALDASEGRFAAWQVGRPPWNRTARPDAMAGYRDGVAAFLAEARKIGTSAPLWVGATPSLLASALSEGPVLAGTEGVALVLDADASAPSLRSGAYRRAVDYGLRQAARMGVRRGRVAATGEQPGAARPQQTAWKLVTRHVLGRAAGARRVDVVWGRGLPEPGPAAAAHAYLAHLVGDATYEADLWPDVPLLEGHLYTGTTRRVVVVWSWVGANPAEPEQGLLVLPNGRGLEARDVMGHPVGIPKDRQLLVPLGEAPVYLVSETLSAAAMRERIGQAWVRGVAPATVWIEDIIRGRVPGYTRVTAWIQSHRPYRRDVRAALLVPSGWRQRTTKQQFSLGPGEARTMVFECDVRATAGPPPYRMEIAAEVGDEWVRHARDIRVTRIPQRSVRAGGGLEEWTGISPYVLTDGDGLPAAQVRVAWDVDHLHVAAVVPRDRPTFRRGGSDYGGDAIQIGFGFDGWADDHFGQVAPGDAYPVGAYRDTDVLVALTATREGASAVLLRKPYVALRTHLEGNMDPWFGRIEGARASIRYDEMARFALYEASIPWSVLEPLRPEVGRSLRMDFLIGQGGERPPLQWSARAGVPDYLANPATFLPLSESTCPCATRWALGEAKPK